MKKNNYQTITLRIEPIKIGNYYEPCIVSVKAQVDDFFYPVGHAHIDVFYASPKDWDTELYEALNNGKTAEIDVPLVNFRVLDEDSSE